MIKLLNKSDCCGCSACYSICPEKCIEMVEDTEGFLYPEINIEKCINCGLCEKVCPHINIEQYSKECDVYACINKDEKIRFLSSSGGFFSVISEYVLQNNGVVFGAAFDEKFEVEHIAIDKMEELYKLRGSKYVQSNTKNNFNEVKRYLNAGKLVLYSGTPCQIAGLKKYLMKDYENLILVDVICHGVPSPGVFRRYLESKKQEYKSEICGINFRAKELAIQAIKITFENQKVYLKNWSEDFYYTAFASDLILRPACYDCKSNDFRSGSDISIADYWGAKTKFSDLNELEGVSLIITKTKIGRKILDIVKTKLELKKSTIEHSSTYNPNIHKSSKLNKNRRKFFKKIENNKKNIEIELKSILKIKFRDRVISKIKRESKKIIKKIIRRN